MAVYIYHNGQYHLLAGNKIAKNGAWVTMKPTDKMVIRHVPYLLGTSASQPVTPPSIPDIPEVQHNQPAAEPTRQKWYVTPSGAGDQSGTSWANARPSSQIHVTLLDASRVDGGGEVYMSEGDYSLDRTVTLPANVNIYGGFPTNNHTWATRNGFTHQTKLSGAGTFLAIDAHAAVAGQIVDGIVITDTFTDSMTGPGTLRNSTVLCPSSAFNAAEYCVFTGHGSTISTATNCNITQCGATNISTAIRTNVYNTDVIISNSADTCLVRGREDAIITASIKGAKDTQVWYAQYPSGSLFDNPISGNSAHYCSAEYISANQGGAITNCAAYNCTTTQSLFDSSTTKEFGNNSGGAITNCTAYNCTAPRSLFISKAWNDYSSSRSGGAITNCAAYNCTTSGSLFDSSSEDTWTHSSGGAITNCTAYNCTTTGSLFDSSTRSSYANSSGGAITNCTAYNCTATQSFIKQYGIVYNFLAIFSSATDADAKAINAKATNCTIACCNAPTVYADEAENCVSWNNSGTEYQDYSKTTTCAGSNSNSALALVLGQDNTIARFTNTGFAPAKGPQDVGPCPDPASDQAGFDAWLAQFGDWHPQADSFLVGLGTADADVTTDLDGDNRPATPTLGAYEP